MSNFHPIDLHQLSINPFQAIADQWIDYRRKTGGRSTKSQHHDRQLGWTGTSWGKDVAFAFIRPQRYTKQFVDENDCFSLCFFGGEQMEALRYLGTASGRDEDKIAKSGLTLTHIDSVPCFEEASLVLLCRKLYVQTLNPEAVYRPDSCRQLLPEPRFPRPVHCGGSKSAGTMEKSRQLHPMTDAAVCCYSPRLCLRFLLSR